MKRIFAIIGIVFLVSSCVSLGLPSISFGGSEDGNGSGMDSGNQTVFTMHDQGNKGHWVSLPSNGNITIIGVTSPMTIYPEITDAEIAAAKEDAARKIAMYYGVEGLVEITSGFDGRAYFGSVSEFNVELTYDQDYSKYIERLTFDKENDVIKVDGVIYVRFQFAASADNVKYTVAKTGDTPQWVTKKAAPKIDGYMTTIGTSKNQSRLKDTINKSIESAIAMLIQEMSTEVTNTDTTFLDSTGAGMTSNIVNSTSKGKLNGFHVIETWIDPQTKYVYTLAIAKRSE